jgi:hypothetical protein
MGVVRACLTRHNTGQKSSCFDTSRWWQVESTYPTIDNSIPRTQANKPEVRQKMGDTNDRKVKTDKTKRAVQTRSTRPWITILDPVPHKLSTQYTLLLKKENDTFPEGWKKEITKVVPTPFRKRAALFWPGLLQRFYTLKKAVDTVSSSVLPQRPVMTQTTYIRSE